MDTSIGYVGVPVKKGSLVAPSAKCIPKYFYTIPLRSILYTSTMQRSTLFHNVTKGTFTLVYEYKCEKCCIVHLYTFPHCIVFGFFDRKMTLFR